MALFVLALFPQFVHPEAGSLIVQMLVLATVVNGIGLFVNGSVILLSGHIRSRVTGLVWFRKLPQYLLAMVFWPAALHWEAETNCVASNQAGRLSREAQRVIRSLPQSTTTTSDHVLALKRLPYFLPM